MSIFSSLKPVAHNARNGFDKTRRDVFSTKPGIITPCFVEDTIPDSVYDVNVVDIVRTNPIQSAPFARMSQNIEYYFVPYSQIWRDFDKMFYERGDNQRNVGNVQNVGQATHVPYFSLIAVIHALYEQFVVARLYEYTKSTMLAGDQYDQEAWYSHLSWWQDIAYYHDVHGRLCGDDMIRNFDLLGYGNLLPLFKSCFAYDVLGTTNNLASIVSRIYNELTAATPTFSLFEQAVTDCVNDATNVQGTTPIPMWKQFYTDFIAQGNRFCSIIRLAAFYKIWCDMYRNSQYDVNTNYAYYFNYDYVVNDSLALIQTYKVMQMLVPNYRQYKKDIFTGSYPTAQFGSVAVAVTENPVHISSTDLPNASSAYPRVLSSDGRLYMPSTYTQSGQNVDTWNIDSSVSALNIRQALAFQKYRERILRAGNRQMALQRAIFGDESRYVKDEYVDFLGAVHSNIDFNNVAATAEGASVNLGELGSNGVSTHGGSAFKYHSHDHGVIIGVCYVLPESEYDAYGMDAFNTMTESTDFFKPDFENLGLSPVFNFNFNYLNVKQQRDAVLGYLARYWQYKTQIDKVHGEFYGSLPYEYYVNNGSSQIPQYADSFFSSMVGAFADYVTPRNSLAFDQPILSSLYVNPNDVDRIFYNVADTLQASDQFKFNMNHEVKCVLPMSVIGLPV